MNITILNNGSEPLRVSYADGGSGAVFPLNPGKFATLDTDAVISVEEMKVEEAA